MEFARKDILDALKAEGFEFNRRKRYWFNIFKETEGVVVFSDHLWACLRLCCKSKEDLPRVLVDDEGSRKLFGYSNWDCAYKRVLSRLLQGG